MNINIENNYIINFINLIYKTIKNSFIIYLFFCFFLVLRFVAIFLNVLTKFLESLCDGKSSLIIYSS